MAARAIWKANLKVGSESLPVKLYSAVQDQTVHFHILESKTQTRVKQHMVNPETESEEPKDTLKKGYEVDRGQFVLLEDGDLTSIEPPASRDIDVEAFIPAGKISHQWYDRPYYLGPDGDSDSYFALAEALTARKREGFATWVMRKKSYIGSLQAADGYLVLATLRHSDEVLSARDLPQPSGRALDPREIKMAQQLIEVLEGDFRPEEFRDEYRDRVMNYIESKAKGKKPKLVKISERRPSEASLTDVLAASLKAVNKASTKDKGKRVA